MFIDVVQQYCHQKNNLLMALSKIRYLKLFKTDQSHKYFYDLKSIARVHEPTVAIPYDICHVLHARLPLALSLSIYQ